MLADIVWAAFFITLTLWQLAMGVLMWRKAGAAANL